MDDVYILHEMGFRGDDWLFDSYIKAFQRKSLVKNVLNP